MILYSGDHAYAKESTRMIQGIMFCLPSRQRFIPYSWLLYSEVNERKTEIHFHYTHAVVTVTGANLGHLHEAVLRHELYALRELMPAALAEPNEPTVSRIEITEKVLD